MPATKPAERQLVARLAAHESWARTPNRTARTAPARDVFLAKFDDLVDPNRDLPPDERARRAANARKAHFTRLALKSAQARRASASRRQALEDLAEATEMLASAIAAVPLTDEGHSHPDRVSPAAGNSDEHGRGGIVAEGGAVR